MKHTFIRLVSAFFVALMTFCLLGSSVTPSVYYLVQNAGSALAREGILNFSGAGVSCVDDSGGRRTTCTISGASNANYTQSFTSQTSVALTHNLNTLTTLTQCYDGSNIEVIPNTTTITSVNVVTVTFSIAQTGFCNVSGAVGSPITTTTIHHQFFTGATHPGTCPSGAGDVSATINGTAATNLCGAGNNQLGITGPYAASALGMIYVFLPPTWTGALTITLESSTSTNATGNFSFTPAYSCVASGKDLVAAPTYTSGSVVTVAAPGGSGSGFYRVPVSLSITPTCTAGQGVQLAWTRGGSDTYSDSIFLMGADLAITY